MDVLLFSTSLFFKEVWVYSIIDQFRLRSKLKFLRAVVCVFTYISSSFINCHLVTCPSGSHILLSVCEVELSPKDILLALQYILFLPYLLLIVAVFFYVSEKNIKEKFRKSLERHDPPYFIQSKRQEYRYVHFSNQLFSSPDKKILIVIKYLDFNQFSNKKLKRTKQEILSTSAHYFKACSHSSYHSNNLEFENKFAASLE